MLKGMYAHADGAHGQQALWVLAEVLDALAWVVDALYLKRLSELRF